MSSAALLPQAHARQWLRLRQLRVQRARQALARAQAEEGQARAAVNAREVQIEQGRARLTGLLSHWGGPGSADMPRWGDQVQAHREALAERLERDEYALLDERETLEQAQGVVRERRADLARAESREAAVEATLKDQRRQARQAHEQQAELEAEDAGRAVH
jgi:multidrug resistance efflux pump